MTHQNETSPRSTEWPLPDSYLIELGRISALWTTLEALLIHCISKLAGLNDLNDPTAFILLHHSNFTQKSQMLETLCEQLSPHAKNLGPYKQTINKINSAKDSRNLYAHTGMSRNENGDIYMAIGSARGKLKVATKKVEITDLRQACARINDATQSLYSLIFDK